jgi:hypothetical protein
MVGQVYVQPPTMLTVLTNCVATWQFEIARNRLRRSSRLTLGCRYLEAPMPHKKCNEYTYVDAN